MSTSSWVRDTLEGRSGPRRPALSILAWVGIGICGVIALAYGLLAGIVGGGGIGAFLLGLLFAMLPVPLLIFAVLSLDRLEPEPTRNLVLTFAWGAAVSVALALGLQLAIGFLIPSERFGLVVAAPITEELAKGLIIFLILHLRKTELDGPTDGLVYAGMVGLGFAFSENIVYYGQAFGEGAGSLVGTFVLRGVFSPLAHPLFTAATGVALGFAALKRDKAMRWLLPIAGLLLAMILHGLWNGSSSSTFGILALAAFYFLIMVPVLVGCILIAYFDRRRVLKQLAVYLPAYVPAGIFHRDEVHLLTTMKSRRKLRHLMRDYQQAATELAMLDDHAARGTAGPEYGPRREALVRILMLAKQAFPGNEGVAANLAQVEGTLPPPPLPRQPAVYGPPAGGGYGQPTGGYGHPPAAAPGQAAGPPPQGPRPVPPPGGQGQPPRQGQGPPPGGQGPPPGGQGPPPGQGQPPRQGQGPPPGGQGPPPGGQGPPPGGQGPPPGQAHGQPPGQGHPPRQGHGPPPGGQGPSPGQGQPPGQGQGPPPGQGQGPPPNGEGRPSGQGESAGGQVPPPGQGQSSPPGHGQLPGQSPPPGRQGPGPSPGSQPRPSGGQDSPPGGRGQPPGQGDPAGGQVPPRGGGQNMSPGQEQGTPPGGQGEPSGQERSPSRGQSADGQGQLPNQGSPAGDEGQPPVPRRHGRHGAQVPEDDRPVAPPPGPQPPQ